MLLSFVFLILSMAQCLNSMPLDAQGEQRSINNENPDGSSNGPGVSADPSGGSNYQSGYDGLSSGSNSSGASGSGDFTDQNTGDGSGSVSPITPPLSGDGNSNVYQVSDDLLAYQKSLDSIKEAYELTKNELKNQLDNFLAELAKEEQNQQSLQSSLSTDKADIEKNEQTKKEAEENVNVINSNISTLQKTEINILKKITPLKNRLNSLMSDLKKVQQTKQQQITLLNTNKSKTVTSEQTISHMQLDAQTKKVQLTETTSRINELKDKIEQNRQTSARQDQNYVTARSEISNKILNTIQSKGIGKVATCPGVEELSPVTSDNLQKEPRKSSPLRPTFIEETRSFTQCENLCSCDNSL